jgi:MoaA/NifB/PqqE/SkfB family radical SAM enzyme
MDIKNGLWLNKNGKKICYNPWTHFEVNNPNGNVTMCCDVDTVLGNINEQSIEEIWNGKMYQKMRRMMFEEGGEKMCSPNCLLLNGCKDYQSFSWYSSLPPNSPLAANANLNEEEIRAGKEILESKPRWMRFTISYRCNYNCYHCYQKDDRKENINLPAKFITDLKGLAQYYQFLFIFGGEPTIFPEFSGLLNFADENPFMLFGMATNGSMVHKYIEQIKKVKWAFISVSLDAASPAMYKELRKVNNWGRVNKNIMMLSELRKDRCYEFNLGMTMNSKNCRELYDFVRLSHRYGATPKISLVSNPDGISFFRQYLWFSNQKRKDILTQIERILQDFPYTNEATGLNILERQFNVGSLLFYLTQLKSIAIIIIPASLKNVVKRYLRCLR